MALGYLDTITESLRIHETFEKQRASVEAIRFVNPELYERTISALTSAEVKAIKGLGIESVMSGGGTFRIVQPEGFFNISFNPVGDAITETTKGTQEFVRELALIGVLGLLLYRGIT